MGLDAIALKPPRIWQWQEANLRVFEKMQGLIEKIISAKFSVASGGSKEYEAILGVRARLISWLEQKYPNSNFKNQSEQLEFYLAESSRDFAITYLEKRGEDVEDMLTRGDYKEINKLIERKFQGSYNCIGKRFFGIDLERINADYPSQEARDACLVKTFIHESLHHLGDFGDFHEGKDLEWLSEGTTEFLARRILKDLFPEKAKIHDSKKEGYDDYVKVINSLIEIVGEGFFLKAYFSNSLAMLEAKLKEICGSDKEFNDLLDCGDKLVKNRDDKSLQVVFSLLEQIKSLQKRRKNIKVEEEDESQNLQTSQNAATSTPDSLKTAKLNKESVEKAIKNNPRVDYSSASKFLLLEKFMESDSKTAIDTNLNQLLTSTDIQKAIESAATSVGAIVAEEIQKNQIAQAPLRNMFSDVLKQTEGIPYDFETLLINALTFSLTEKGNIPSAAEMADLFVKSFEEAETHYLFEPDLRAFSYYMLEQERDLLTVGYRTPFEDPFKAMEEGNALIASLDGNQLGNLTQFMETAGVSVADSAFLGSQMIIAQYEEMQPSLIVIVHPQKGMIVTSKYGEIIPPFETPVITSDHMKLLTM